MHRSVAILCPGWQGRLASGVTRGAVGGSPLELALRGSPGMVRVCAAPACVHSAQAVGSVRLQTSVVSRVGRSPSTSAVAPVVIPEAAAVP
eukprot:10089741-Heterocapsa_arctica.AAC.1